MTEFLKFLQTGTPWQILCAVLVVAIVALWRRYVATSDRLFDLAILQTRGYTQVHDSLERMEGDQTKGYEQVLNRIESLREDLRRKI